MCFIPYKACQRCHGRPIQGELRPCRAAQETQLLCQAEDIKDDFAKPRLVVSWCNECGPPGIFELLANDMGVVIRYWFRALVFLPFSILVWVVKDEIIRPQRFDWKRIDKIGDRLSEILQGVFVVITTLPGATFAYTFAYVTAFGHSFIDFCSSLPDDLSDFPDFLDRGFSRYSTVTSLPPPDPFCSAELFHNDRYRRYIPVYEIFAAIKGLLLMYVVTRSPWQDITEPWICSFALMWTWFLKPPSWPVRHRGFWCLLALSVQVLAYLLLRLGAPIYSKVIPAVLTGWASYESYSALISSWWNLTGRQPHPAALGERALLRDFHMPFPLPDWIHGQQRYLNLVNRLSKPGADPSVEEFRNEERQLGTERAMAVFEDILHNLES